MRRKKFKITIAVFIFLLIFTGCLYFYNKYTYTFQEVVKDNWNIELPESYREIYQTNNGRGFDGDGIRYHVLQYDNLEAVNEMVNWRTTDIVRIDSKVKKLLLNLDIPSEYKINWQEEYKFYYKTQEDLSIGYFILFEDTGRLFVVESFQ